jgi:large subunit ribosomal protein L10
MSKSVNAALIDGLSRDLEGVDSCVLIAQAGMSVAEVTELRAKLRSQTFRMRVVKNSLARRSFDRCGFKGLGDLLTGPSAVVFGGEGVIPIAKVLVEERRKAKEKLRILGGYCDGEVVDAAGVEALSKAPSRKELMAMTLAAMFGPVSEMARNLDGLLSEMQGLIEALAKKNGGAPEATVPS